MFVEFDQMPINSRVWIYQADRELTANESNKAAYSLKNSIESWAAHGAPLSASFKIEFDRFIIIALDESKNMASGCSIDASTHWLKELGEQFSLDFFDRSLAYIKEKKVESVSIFKIKNAIEATTIRQDTLVFNNNITRLPELMTKWKVEAKDYPFTAKYFKAVAV